MKVAGYIWLQRVVEKLDRKHNVSTEEVEEVFDQRPQIRLLEGGKVDGEDLYAAYGQTQAGRFLTVVFIHKLDRRALIITARNMDRKERRQYAKSKT